MQKYLLLALGLMLILSCGRVTKQENTGSNAPSLAFNITPYDIEEETTSSPGYKVVRVYMLVENVGPNWGAFKKIEEPTLKTEEGFSAPGNVFGAIGVLPPSVRSIGSNTGGLLSLRFQIGETLHPSSVELRFVYQSVDKFGNASGSWLNSDTVRLDLRNLVKPTGIPFAQDLPADSLPISYTLPKGTFRINSANIDTASPRDRKVIVDVEFTSSDPAETNYAGIHARLLTADGIICDGQLIKGTMNIHGVGPLQTVNDSLKFFFIKDVPLSAPVYLMVYSVDIDNDTKVVNQIIEINE